MALGFDAISDAAISGDASVQSGVTIALTGVSAVFAPGTLAPSTTLAVTGALATFGAGTVTYSAAGDLTLSLTGQAATFSAGTLTPSSTIATAGSGATFAAGALLPASSIAITGQLAAFAQGGLGIQAALALSGQSASFANGTITPQQAGDIVLALSGQSATFSGGIILASGAAADAGRRVRSIYRITIDGVMFECRTYAEALQLLDQAKETARKLAEDQALWAIGAQDSQQDPVSVPKLYAPKIEVSSRELRSAASSTKRDIAAIYESEAKIAELRILLELSKRQQDDDDVLSLFL